MIILVSLSATAAGVILLYPGLIPPDLRMALLHQTPFTRYSIAGLLCLITISGSALVGLYTLLMNVASQYRWTTISGFLLGVNALLDGLLTQSATVIHLAMAATGLLIVLISYQLKGKWAV